MLTCPHCKTRISRVPDHSGIERVPTRMVMLKSNRVSLVCPNKTCRKGVPLGTLEKQRLTIRVVDTASEAQV